MCCGHRCCNFIVSMFHMQFPLFRALKAAKFWALATVFVGFTGFSLSAQAEAPAAGYPVIPKYGPNCWNVVLKHHEAISYFRMVFLSEFWLYANSPYCKPLNSGEVPQSGDIGTVIRPSFGVFHSFVVIDAEKGLSKETPFPKDQIEYINLNFLKIGSDRLIYHRCDFSTLSQKTASFYRSIQNQLLEIEKSLEKYILGLDALDKAQILKHLAVLFQLHTELLKVQRSSTNTFAFNMVLFKSESLAQQAAALLPDSDLNPDLNKKIQYISDLEVSRMKQINLKFK